MTKNPHHDLTERLQTLGRGDGELFDVAGARFVWKVKDTQTDNAFAMYEMELASGQGVPLHHHPYAEIFYVLSGEVDFLQYPEGEWVVAVQGATIVVPLDRPHAFYNRTAQPAKLLSVSNTRHQQFFDAVAAADQMEPFATMPFPAAMGRVASIGQQLGVQFMPFEPPSLR